MAVRELRRALKNVETGTPISIKYRSRLGPDEAIGRYDGENGYRLFLRFGPNEDTPAGMGSVSLKSVSEVSTLHVRRHHAIYSE